MQKELNEALKELAGYYIIDIKNLENDLIAVMCFSQKKEAYFPFNNGGGRN